MSHSFLNHHWEDGVLFIEANDIEAYIRRAIITVADGRDEELVTLKEFESKFTEKSKIDHSKAFIKECDDQIEALQQVADRFVGWMTFAHYNHRTGKVFDIDAPLSEKIRLTRQGDK